MFDYGFIISYIKEDFKRGVVCQVYASRILSQGNILRLAATETKKWWSLYSCELRRFLGGATHFASFHEALAEQSALGSLVHGTDSLTLDYDPRSNQLS